MGLDLRAEQGGKGEEEGAAGGRRAGAATCARPNSARYTPYFRHAALAHHFWPYFRFYLSREPRRLPGAGVRGGAGPRALLGAVVRGGGDSASQRAPRGARAPALLALSRSRSPGSSARRRRRGGGSGGSGGGGRGAGSDHVGRGGGGRADHRRGPGGDQVQDGGGHRQP